MWSLTEEEFMNYFLNTLPEVMELIKNHGMSLLVDGGTTNLDEYGVSRDIFLGSNQGESFVRERHFTVTEEGLIFEYDPMDDIWYLEYNPFPAVG